MALPSPREACYETMRELVSYDPWMIRWALFQALGYLDLNQLQRLVVETADAFDTPEDQRARRAQMLLEERYRR